ncbi:uncharacterized protein LOC103098397 isoform X2 [Monodelphis domestica]|uniref:uncharacterized protein LOC103098397 isoform X2 n=1 Tax=Monodelphis domestica TaxID=13616 RepID=UPI0024E27266|nr:uncharacterized protein LOC103098397 isoform X2 [Monodelphis domestica]
MMQRRVQQLDLFSCQIDKGENELGLCTRIFFDPADEDEKDPGVFITEIAEGGAAHKLGWIEIGREPPEVKTELIILLELSEERKKFFTDSVIVQEKVGDIKIVKGKARNSKTPKISWLWITRELELKNEEMELKRIIEEEGQKYKKRPQGN